MSTFDTARSDPASLPRIALWAGAGDDPHQSHVVQFYAEDTFLLDELSSFVGTALGGGGVAIVICTKVHRDGLAQRLEARGFDISHAVGMGRYVQMDASDTLSRFMVDGWPDTARFTELMGRVLSRARAAAEGDMPRIAAFGEMVALLWAQGKAEAAIRLEQLWNDLARIHSFSLRCAYPIGGFSLVEHGGPFARICAEHSCSIPDESYTMLVGEEERLRTITHLQQKAQALETEVATRKQVEEELRCSKAQLESLVEQRTVALRQLSLRLLNIQDAERRRLARELHDSVGQYLLALKLNMNLLRKKPERQELWSQSEELMTFCISEVRTISHLLHPPTMDEVGFASAARWYINGFSERTGIKVTLNLPDSLTRFPEAVELALFRVLQESLTNVHRHSGASTTDILVERSATQVMLEVKDNGHGMPEERVRRFRGTGAGVGVGLMSMSEQSRELGGTLQLQSDENGTSVRVTIPVLLACSR